MIIRINGREETLGNSATLGELVAARKLAPERIVIEHNLRIVPRGEWPKTALREKDSVEIVSFVGGG